MWFGEKKEEEREETGARGIEGGFSVGKEKKEEKEREEGVTRKTIMTRNWCRESEVGQCDAG